MITTLLPAPTSTAEKLIMKISLCTEVSETYSGHTVVPMLQYFSCLMRHCRTLRTDGSCLSALFACRCYKYSTAKMNTATSRHFFATFCFLFTFDRPQKTSVPKISSTQQEAFLMLLPDSLFVGSESQISR